MSKSKKQFGADEIRRLLGITEDQCMFCLQSENDEEKFGKLLKKYGLTLHYFCMLFASGLSQRGETDEHGISGFLPGDVVREIRRGLRLKCSFCKEKGATIGCVVGKCRLAFHYGCGIKNNTLHQFFDTFSSFCADHRPQQNFPDGDTSEMSTCAICITPVEAKPSIKTIRSPCCLGSWFHRSCIQKHALTAGLYFFKCPLCNNKEEFQQEMLRLGIQIPDQDAAWETEPNAFNDLLERYLHCDAPRCLCEQGRDYNKDGGKWEILVCDWCGSTGSHVGCRTIIKVGPDDYMCHECYEIEEKWNKCNGIKYKKKKGRKKKPSPRANKRLEDPNLTSKGKSEYQQQLQKPRKVTLPVNDTESPCLSDSLMSSPSSATNLTELKNRKNECLPTSHAVTNSRQESPVFSGFSSQCSDDALKFKTVRKRYGAWYYEPVSSDEDSVLDNKRIQKRKRKQNDALRKILKLDIDMTWNDVDSSDSETERRPKKLRRRSSTITAMPNNEINTKKKIKQKQPPPSTMTYMSEDEDDARQSIHNVHKTVKNPNIYSWLQSSDEDDTPLADIRDNMKCKHFAPVNSYLKNRNHVMDGKSTQVNQISNDIVKSKKKKYKVNSNQMLIKNWLEIKNSNNQNEWKLESKSDEGKKETDGKQEKRTLKIRFKGKTFMFQRHIKSGQAFKENLAAGESLPNSKPTLKQNSIKRAMPLQNIDQNPSYSQTSKQSSGVHIETMVSPLLKFPDETINSCGKTMDYKKIKTNVSVKCSLEDKFQENKMLSPKSYKGSTSSELSALSLYENTSFQNESMLSMPKLSPVDLRDQIFIMKDKNNSDPEVSPIGDTHQCMLVNIQPSGICMDRKEGSLSPSAMSYSESSMSEEEASLQIMNSLSLKYSTPNIKSSSYPNLYISVTQNSPID